MAVNGGAMRDRTADLLRAKQALSQLSYSPITVFFTVQGVGQRSIVFYASCATTQQCGKLVGLSGLEPPTSPLSGVRSNHLSYKPIPRHLFTLLCVACLAYSVTYLSMLLRALRTAP